MAQIYVRDGLRKLVLSDPTVLSLLGDGERSVFPRPDAPPPGKPPWIWLQMLGEPSIDTITRRGGFRWRVYDDTGQQYYNIDQIVGRLLRLFPEGSAVYNDPAGNSWWQRVKFVSEDSQDDQWNLDTRWVEWALWRETP